MKEQITMDDDCWLIQLLGRIADKMQIDRNLFLDTAYQCAEEMMQEEKQNACT